MKLWGGRFTKEENALVDHFNASISFDPVSYTHLLSVFQCLMQISRHIAYIRCDHLLVFHQGRKYFFRNKRRLII